jgi:hypothetical protein
MAKRKVFLSANQRNEAQERVNEAYRLLESGYYDNEAFSNKIDSLQSFYGLSQNAMFRMLDEASDNVEREKLQGQLGSWLED